MNSIVFTHFKAICLLSGTLFVLAASEDQIYFSTKPKDKEVFVGENVQFDWDYVVEDVQEIRFGVVINDKNTAIYIKKKDGTSVLNNLHTSVEWIRDRVEIVPNRRASFKINQVKMEDSVTFFCQVFYGAEGLLSETDKVKLTVVDLLIDKFDSTKAKESWAGRKITVVCAVKVPESLKENAMFSWKHVPSNRTVAREFHDDMRSKSYLSVTTNKDEDFETLQCRAETKATVKFHTINITKLSAPSEPRNLKTETVFNKKSAKTYIRLQWDPPDKTGGSKIEKYLIEYIVNGLAWGSPDTEETQGTEFEGLKLQNGGKYNARVRAQNKAGLGLPSNEVLIDLDIAPQAISDSSHLNHLEVCLLLVSVMAWFL
ncbi:neural cell adhesion molecule 1-like isoform X2 [Oculina patagonica]